LARRIAAAVAAHTIDAEAAQTLAGDRATLAVFLFAIAIAIARIRADAARRIIGSGRHVRARSETPGNVACLARPGARGVATDTVGANGTHAFGTAGANHAIVFLARAIAVAGVRPGTERAVFLANGQIRAGTGRTGDIARFTSRRTRAAATHAIHADAAPALRAERARVTHGELGGATIAAVRPITGFGAGTRIVRISRGHDRAYAQGAQHVARFARLCARAVAAITFDTVAARAFPGEHARLTIGLFAYTHAIAHRPSAAARIERLEWIRRNTRRANVIRADGAVDRNVDIVLAGYGLAWPVTFDDLAIARRLSGREIGPHRREIESAHAVGTYARLAKIVCPGTIIGRDATDALPRVVAFQRPAATRIDRFEWEGRRTVRARVFRARIVVFGQIRVVRQRDCLAHAVAYRIETIAHGLRHEERARERKRLSTNVIVAGARLAFVVRRQHRAIARLIALTANTIAVADREPIGRTRGALGKVIRDARIGDARNRGAIIDGRRTIRIDHAFGSTSRTSGAACAAHATGTSHSCGAASTIAAHTGHTRHARGSASSSFAPITGRAGSARATCRLAGSILLIQFQKLRTSADSANDSNPKCFRGFHQNCPSTLNNAPWRLADPPTPVHQPVSGFAFGAVNTSTKPVAANTPPAARPIVLMLPKNRP